MTTQRKPRDYKKDIRSIHALQRELGLLDDDARALKIQVTGKASSKDMTDRQRARFISHLLKLKDKQRKQLHRSQADQQDARWDKARLLWSALHDAGAVRSNTDAALNSYVKRITKVDAWRWLNTYQINTVLEALKKWCERVGVNPDDVNEG